MFLLNKKGVLYYELNKHDLKKNGSWWGYGGDGWFKTNLKGYLAKIHLEHKYAFNTI